MTRIFFLLLLATGMLTSCSNRTPEQYFSQAALNSNLLYGFAGDGMHRELASPSEKLIGVNSGKTAPMKREEVIQIKLDAVEKPYKKIKSLKIADDSKEMVSASLAMFEFVIPVYKGEYRACSSLR